MFSLVGAISMIEERLSLVYLNTLFLFAIPAVATAIGSIAYVFSGNINYI